ncbi:MAG TPA: hypothetical protein VF600_03230 [Abditibacteriaceae bacterium]
MRTASVRGANFSSLSRRGRARRRGQALLMAVLLMVFAALLGSTFITVVALNLSQTSRNESKRDAELAARAAIEVANTQLTNSTQGENWRPEHINPPPFCGDGTLPADAACNTYYTPFEQAQGWARRVPHPAGWNANNPNYQADWAALEAAKASGQRVFVKFPDPRDQAFSRSKTPSYLVEVAPVTNPNDPNLGSLRIEAIGRADDDDAAFSRSVVYKGTAQFGGPLAFARYDANYDTQKNTLRATRLTAAPAIVATYVTLTVQDASLFVPGQTILIAAGISPTSDRDTAVVKSVNSATSQVTLNRTSLTGTYTAGAQVRAASRLLPNLLDADFDADGNGTPGETGVGETTVSQDSLLSIARSTNGMYFGGGVALDGKGQFQLRGSTTTTSADDDSVLVAGQVAGTSPELQLSTVVGETPAATTQFPNSQTNSGAGLQRLVRDDISSGETGVRPITPPRLEGQNGRPSRYVENTKLADLQRGSQYGYGPGIYIDNREDIEKVRRQLDTSVTPNRTLYRTLKISDMHRLWQRKSFPVDPRYSNEVGNAAYDAATGNTGIVKPAVAGASADQMAHRLVLPRPGVDGYAFPLGISATEGTPSLEQRGIRGWINQFEFLPRGALIELNDIDPTTFEITITRDDRSDTAATYSDRNKAWRSPNGSLIPQAYRMRIRVNNVGLPSEQVVRYVGAPGYDTPAVDTYNGAFNGVIFAEGNVRVRGSIGNKDITIASMGNIYIEGSVRRDRANRNGRVALLAKNNVVLNPTQFLARPSGLQFDGSMGVLSGAGVSTGVDTFSTTDATRFRVGDRVSLNGFDWLVVRSVAFNNATATDVTGTVTLATPHNVAVGSPVTMTLLSDAALISQTNGERSYDLTGANNTLMRDVRFDGALPTTSTTLSWRHIGLMTTAFRIRNDGATDTFSVKKNTISSIPEVISAGTTSLDNEKKLFTGLTEYDLLDIPGTVAGSREGDAVETLDKLLPLFNGTIDASTGLVIPGTDVNTWQLVDLTQLTTPARRIAAIPSDVTLATGESWPVPFATALRQFWRQDLSTLTNAATPYNMIGSSYAPDGNEDIATVAASFYQRVNPVGNVPVQASLIPYNSAAPLSPIRSGENLLALHRDSGLGVAGYRMTRPRLEDDNFSAATPDFKPGMNIDIDATLFAQEGSWFVIPAPMEVVAAADTDSSGAVDAAEQAAANAATTRYRRLNYRVAVRGTIAQNMTPTGMTDYDLEQTPDQPVTDTTSPGAMQQWIDSLSHPTTIASDGANLRGQRWMGIYYAADPLDYSAVNGGAGLYLPVSPDLLYVG